MPPTTRHRSRSSVEHLFDLVQDLDDHQLQDLLLEINSSAENNIEVSKAIDMFEAPSKHRRESRPPCLDLTAMSPGSPPPIPDWPMNRPITWRQSKRVSSVPLNYFAPNLQHDPMPTPGGRRISSVPLSLMHPPTDEPTTQQQQQHHHRERSVASPRLLESPPLISSSGFLSQPDEPLRPRTSTGDGRPQLRRSASRSYRRISRPMFLAPGGATPDLARQLSAYFLNEPIAEVPGLSPTTPGSMTSSSSEYDLGMGGGLGLDDLLEPDTPRSRMVFGRPEREVPVSMSGIFEVLGDS